jgi:hypothetical protein
MRTTSMGVPMRTTSIFQARYMTVLFAFFFVVSGSSALAIPFDLVGVNDLNNTAHVEFTYTASSATVATISLSIQNTSILYDPILTGFALNLPNEVTAVPSFTGPSGWSSELDWNDINSPGQFGHFDLAGLTGPNLLGGNTGVGIAIGSPVDFSFGLVGVELDTLTADTFLALLSDDERGNGTDPQFFIARFQGTGPDGDSDVAIPSDGGAPVPEPATAFLLGSGLIGLAAFRRRTGA